MSKVPIISLEAIVVKAYRSLRNHVAAVLVAIGSIYDDYHVKNRILGSLV
jgi:hypothetical protein